MKINPLVPILFNFIVPISIMFIYSFGLSYMLLAFSIFCLVILKRFKRIIKVLIVYSIFELLYYLSFNFLQETNSFVLFITILLVVSIKFMPVFVMASIIVIDYKPTQILTVLESIHLPKSLAIAFTITIRYLPTFKKEFKFIKESMRVRGIAYTWKNPLKSFEYFIVPQLFRCAILSEEITAAGLTKGIDFSNKRTSFYNLKFRITDLLLTITFILIIVGSIIWKI